MSWLFDTFKILKGDSNEKVSDEKRKNRAYICNACPNKVSLFTQQEHCDICGCIIKEKIKYKDEKCPINKW
jgi:hypothetical protein